VNLKNANKIHHDGGGGDPFFAYYNFLHTKKVKEKEEFWKNLRRRVSLFDFFL